MKTKIVKGWTLLHDEKDLAYDDYSLESLQWQKGMFYSAMSYVQNFRTCIDIGSSYGAASNIFARNFDHVHAIEMYSPFIECAKINNQQYNNITHHNYAIHEVEGSTRVKSALWGGYTSLHPFPESLKSGNYVERDDENFRVPVTKFDRFAYRYDIQNIDLIKVDIEQSENYFVSHCNDILQRDKPVVIIEIFRRSGTLKEIMERFTEKYDYVLVNRIRNDYILVHKKVVAQGYTQSINTEHVFRRMQ